MEQDEREKKRKKERERLKCIARITWKRSKEWRGECKQNVVRSSDILFTLRIMIFALTTNFMGIFFSVRLLHHHHHNQCMCIILYKRCMCAWVDVSLFEFVAHVHTHFTFCRHIFFSSPSSWHVISFLVLIFEKLNLALISMSTMNPCVITLGANRQRSIASHNVGFFSLVRRRKMAWIKACFALRLDRNL